MFLFGNGGAAPFSATAIGRLAIPTAMTMTAFTATSGCGSSDFDPSFCHTQGGPVEFVYSGEATFTKAQCAKDEVLISGDCGFYPARSNKSGGGELVSILTWRSGPVVTTETPDGQTRTEPVSVQGDGQDVLLGAAWSCELKGIIEGGSMYLEASAVCCEAE